MYFCGEPYFQKLPYWLPQTASDLPDFDRNITQKINNHNENFLPKSPSESTLNCFLRRSGPSGQEEWVGNSLVQKGTDDLYTVTETLYNSAITNANIDVRFFNETDSSQSTLTIQNVETDYDNLFNYFCKVQFNDPEQGMIADLKASDEENFDVFGKQNFNTTLRIYISHFESLLPSSCDVLGSPRAMLIRRVKQFHNC